MSDRTASNFESEIRERKTLKSGAANGAEAGSAAQRTDLRVPAWEEDQAIHLLLTAWTLVLEEEQQRR